MSVTAAFILMAAWFCIGLLWGAIWAVRLGERERLSQLGRQP